jgi:glycosyltransferase involved in cell wall biosynthesis
VRHDHDGKMVRSVIIDPALKTESGHHLRLSIELSKAACSMGHEPLWLGHKALDPRLVPDFVRFIPAFSSSIYERQIGIFGRALRPLVGTPRYMRSTLAERAWEIRVRQRLPMAFLDGDRCRELIKALEVQKLGPDDHLIVHSADPQTVAMLTTWASRQPRSKLPGIHIRTCWSHSTMPFADYGGGFAQTLCQMSATGRIVTVSAETAAGARLLADKTGLRVELCPHLIDERTMQLDYSGKNPHALVVGWLGEPRPEKGVSLLPNIIRETLNTKSPRPLRFLLQCGGRNSRKARYLDSQLAEFGDVVERLDVAIPQDSYLAALKRCDIILLPYDPHTYPPERGSGAAIEALLTGKPMVATARTFAAELIQPDSGVTATDASSLAEGLLRIAADYDYYFRGAMRARDRAQTMYDRVATYCRLIGHASK